MAMYAIGTLPLIRELQPLANQVWYADDSAAGSSIAKLKDWWTKLCQKGAKYGYFVNNMKTKLLVKEEYSSLAQELFGESGITIVSDGVVYLGGAIGSVSFMKEHVKHKVADWKDELIKLAQFAETQPHSSYAALTHGVQSKWSYHLRITDWDSLNVTDLLNPIEDTLISHIIPALSGQSPPGHIM